ncbi:MAG: acetyl-CoA carboxylase, carboxyltransferase subunit beta [Elusimicrobia bacterium]|nr:acetyl-CoA carboxylase, carboxyltransferase subunit beta [Elusimicrobiota bacterium]
MVQTVSAAEQKKSTMPEGLWTKCKKCEQIIFQKDLEENYMICSKCGYNFRLGFKKRIELMTDAKSFKEMFKGIVPVNFLDFPGYSEKMKSYPGLDDAIVAGEAKIGGNPVMLAVMDFEFMGGSMGSVVGEKIALAVEAAIEKKCPVIIVSASGGARMQEGIVSLMQMGKTSAALARLAKHKLPYISLLTDPTTGGVAASYAMLGDINIAEQDALIGFAGPRVIEQTIRQQLPDGFQLSEFLKRHGMVDMVIERKDLKNTLIKILNFFCKK